MSHVINAHNIQVNDAKYHVHVYSSLKIKFQTVDVLFLATTILINACQIFLRVTVVNPKTPI